MTTIPTNRQRLGVGILGAGPVVQAIHLPTLARLTDRFSVEHIMDIDESLVSRVAEAAGARWSLDAEAVLADPSVDVIAICSPSHLHAEQAIAAMRAGKRAVLIEKPFALSDADAERIAAVAADTGIPVVVGAMHVFDPGVVRALEISGTSVAHSIRSQISIPFNARFEDAATEILGRPANGALPATSTVAERAALLTMGVMGLAIHDLPLVRRFLAPGAPLRVHRADLVAPFGYTITLTAGDTVVQFVGSMHTHAAPEWTLQITTADGAVELDLPPSYVHAGSASGRVRRAESTPLLVDADAENGYVGEWVALHDAVHGDTHTLPTITDLVEDLRFATALAEGAAEALLTRETL